MKKTSLVEWCILVVLLIAIAGAAYDTYRVRQELRNTVTIEQLNGVCDAVNDRLLELERRIEALELKEQKR